MLHIFYGEMSDVIYDTSIYFKNTYEDEWITSGRSGFHGSSAAGE